MGGGNCKTQEAQGCSLRGFGTLHFSMLEGSILVTPGPGLVVFSPESWTLPFDLRSEVLGIWTRADQEC